MAEKGWNNPKMPGKDPKAAGMLEPTTDYTNETAFNEHGWMADGPIRGMNRPDGEMLDKAGMDSDGNWLYKKGTPYGEAAYFNQLPPGMDINNQKFSDIRPMTLKFCDNGYGYPGDSPWPVRDVQE